MHRCRATMRAVYRQHQEAAKSFATGLPESFEVMIRPGYSILYLRSKEIKYDGTWDGVYIYESDDPQGWEKFYVSHDSHKAFYSHYLKPIVKGDISFFESFLSKKKHNPYKLR